MTNSESRINERRSVIGSELPLTHSLLAACVTLFLLVAASASAAPINVDDPPPGRFLDQWLELYIGEKKVGYGHSTLTREEDLVHAGQSFTMKMSREGVTVGIRLKKTTTETVQARPVAFETVMDAAVVQTSTRGTIEDGKVTIVTSQFGLEQTQTYDYPEGALMDWGLFREQVQRGFEPGTKYTVRMYVPDMRLDDAVEATNAIGEWETFQHRGDAKRGQRVVTTLQAPFGALEMVSWVDRDGTPIKMQLPMPGFGNMEMVVVDEATALGDFVPPEMFTTSTIKANRKIDPASAQKIRYRVRLKQGSTSATENLSLPTTAMQKVSEEKEGAVNVVVSRIERRDDGGSPTKVNPAEMAEYLRPNLMINTADPDLIALAEKAAGSEKDPYELADRLRKFVSDYVEDKSLSVGFATASEVARRREGDCSEHGVLLAALGRIAGLPSRVVVGLAYVPVFGRNDDIFGYHLWTQFHIDGRWVDVDAALGETDCSPTRIAFATSSLHNSGLADLSLPLLDKLGAIEVEIVKVDTRTQE